MRRPVRPTGALTAAVLALVLGVAGCSSDTPSATGPTPNLEVVSWWTSGSEQQSLGVLFDSYRAGHSGVDVANATVAGGGGSNAQVVLAQRLISGDPPDAWQTFPGGALSAFVAQDQVRDVSSVYAADGLATVLPKPILDGLTVDGHQYGVPTSAHRGNVLFFNRALLTKAGVALPGAGYTAAQFRADLGTLDDAGITPLCLGAKDAFTTTALFENTLLGVVGPDGWQRISADRFDWDGPQAREALNQFGAILDHADPEAAALSWDAATKKLAAGGCAFESLNDSAYGELLTAGAVDGRDFSEVPYPGTDASYVAVVDTFVSASKAANAKNALDFLAVIGSADTQVAFSKVKGSVPVRTDADVSSLTPYQQSAAQALRTGTVLWSITHGEATSPRFQQGFYDAVATYVRSRDARAFSKTLTDALAQQPPAK
jgi:glucose/mannose transport system substrate-binding protein